MNPIKEKKTVTKPIIIKILFWIGLFSLLLGVLSLGINIVKIFQNFELEISMIIELVPGIILVILGSYFIEFSRKYNELYKYFGVIAITIGSFLLSSSIVLLSFSSQVSELSKNIQPSLDFLIIDYISNQEGTEYEILQDLLNTTVSFETFDAAKLSPKQNLFLQESFDINSIEDLSIQEKEELPSKIISTIYDSLKQQNQFSILNSPIPIDQISTFIRSSGNIELTLISMSYLYETNEEALLILMVPDEEQLNSSTKNLNHIREECNSLNSNQICDAFQLSKYGNLMKYLIQNTSSLPITINTSTLESYNSMEKLEKNITKKSSLYKEFLLGSMFFFLLGYYLLEQHYKKKEGKVLHILRIISLKISKYFILPTIILSIIILFLKSDFLVSILNTYKVEGLEEISNTIVNLPLFENVIEIIILIITYHLVILSSFGIIFFITYWVEKRKISNNHS